MTALEILAITDRETLVKFTDIKDSIYCYKRAKEWLPDLNINLGVEVRKIEPLENKLIIYI